MPREVAKSVPTWLISRIGISSYSIYLYNNIFSLTPEPIVTGIRGAVVYVGAVMLFGFGFWWLVERQSEKVRHKLIGRAPVQPVPLRVN